MVNIMELRGGRILDFNGPCMVMAIVNCTYDSFYAPNKTRNDAVRKALEAERQGASIVDFGGESSRPGAEYIDEEDELERVIPAIEEFRKLSRLPVSVDTRKAAVARAALDAGADIINDISALEDDPLLLSVCKEKNAAVILMHKKGTPADMQKAPGYSDTTAEVGAYLLGRAEEVIERGLSADKIILDPGIGFGKRCSDNLLLINRLAEICGNDYPILVGLSRKSFIGELTGQETKGRLAGTIAANAAAIINGAKIIRVHDVKEAVDTALVLYAVREAVK